MSNNEACIMLYSVQCTNFRTVILGTLDILRELWNRGLVLHAEH